VTLRARLALLVAAAVAAAVAVAAVAAFVTTRAELRRQVDTSLLQFAEQPARAPFLRDLQRLRQLGPITSLPEPLRGVLDVQVVFADGSTFLPLAGGSAIPVSGRALAAAKGGSGPVLEDATVGGAHSRVVTVPIRDEVGGAVQVARPLTEVDRTLSRLGTLLWAVAVVGVVASAFLGLAVARAGLAPVDRLTATAEHVAQTQDLRPIEVRGRDEVARLARSINAMLAALDASRRRQRQLVADAGHELRTPLTSLRTNVELLVRSDAHPDRTLPARDRAALLADLRGQLEELSGLVGDLLELARDEAPVEEVADVRLDELVDRAVQRTRVRAPGLRFEVELQPWRLPGRRRSLERAVTNVLDNAVKWSPPGGLVEVTLADGELRVRDHGPGIDPEELPLVFDRFHRASSARHLPGSGLGLAIVREAVESHGGTATIDSAPGQGTAVRLRLPAARPPAGG
jgi:two-component system, OmpR family, sensor histidine kinase MprB